MRQLLPPFDGPPDLAALYGRDDAHVRGGFVLSLDGAAVVDGSSRALSGPADRAVFRTLRAVSDVVLVGAGTTRVEDYTTIRLTSEGAAWRSARDLTALPRVAVVSRSLDLDAALLASGPIVVTCAAADPSRLTGVEVLVAGDDEVDVSAALDQLTERGLQRVLCEGGPSLLADLVAAGRLDELCLTVSPLLVGAAPGLLPESLGHPVDLRLLSLLEEDGSLLARYALDR